MIPVIVLSFNSFATEDFDHEALWLVSVAAVALSRRECDGSSTDGPWSSTDGRVPSEVVYGWLGTPIQRSVPHGGVVGFRDTNTGMPAGFGSASRVNRHGGRPVLFPPLAFSNVYSCRHVARVRDSSTQLLAQLRPLSVCALHLSVG